MLTPSKKINMKAVNEGENGKLTENEEDNDDDYEDIMEE
jgi:hypothetical protein